MILLAGLALGVAGSGHCASMCGPLLVAFREHSGRMPAGRAVARGVSYHGGRVAMYAVLGLIAGTVGGMAAAGGFGQALAIGSGAVLLASAAGRLGYPVWQPPLAVSRAMTRAIGRAGLLIRTRPFVATSALGALNGLLPCGLVYPALTASMTVGRPIDAALFMAAFGLGTLPALLAIWMAATALPASSRARMRLAGPAALALAGVVLILRGVDGSGMPPHPSTGHVHAEAAHVH